MVGLQVVQLAASGRGCASSSARNLVGRLVEIRVGRLTDVSDVESLGTEVFTAVRSAGPDAVICSDLRSAFLLPGAVADAWSRDMRLNNGAVRRSGLLVDPANAMYNLQVERVVRCAGKPDRRIFTDPEHLIDWVGELLTADERSEARGFLFAEHPV